jgi:hypothetical protein
MAIDYPHRPTSSAVAYVLALIALVAIIVIAATSLWQADNSGTNALSGDPQATTPQSPQTHPDHRSGAPNRVSPLTVFRVEPGMGAARSILATAL